MSEKRKDLCMAPGCVDESTHAEMIDSSDMSHTDKDITIVWLCDRHVNEENTTFEV